MNDSLALAIIVADEAFELERLMKSVQGLFDEIVVVVTVKTGAVYDVARKYASTVEYFEWIEDFAAARNFSFSLVKSEFIFWLDADDIITPDNKAKIQTIKSELHNYDAFFFQWNYSHDAFGNPESVLYRERIIRKSKAKWEGEVHESIPIIGCRSKRYFDIFVDHYRMKPCNTERNLKILKRVYETKPTPRMTFYYGRDLFEIGRKEEAISVLEKYVQQSQGQIYELVCACIHLSEYYVEKKDLKLAKEYTTRGLSFSSEYAELYVLMAEIARIESNFDQAILYNKEALKKTLTAEFTQVVSAYTWTPASNLSVLYDKKGDFDTSLLYNKRALEFLPNDPGLLSDRRYLLSRVAKIRVAWLVPYLDLTFPSTRIRYYNVCEKLKEFGIESEIKSGYYEGVNEADLDRFDIVVFTQYSQCDYDLIRVLKKKGKKVIFDHCEAMFNDVKKKCMSEADAIVSCSTKLDELTKKLGFENFSKVLVIKDPIEPKTVIHSYENREKPKALYMGMGGGSYLVTQDLKETIEKAGYSLEVITEWDDATKKWDLNTWHLDMSDCDVVLCPQKVELHPAKSNVKVTAAMALGMPVIASPLQSYREVIRHGENGFICNSNEEWLKALVELKDPARRQQIGAVAKRSVALYSLDMIACQWIDLLRDLQKDSNKKALTTTAVSVKSDVVDVIIVSYNNVDYLKLCVDSVKKFTENYRLIISDAGSNEETWQYLDSFKKSNVICGSRGRRLNYSQACNEAIANSFSKYFVILNSDVIVSPKNWLPNLVEKMNRVDRLAVCGVLSNCDRGWLHNLPLKLEKANVDLVPAMKIRQIEPYLLELYAFMERSNEEQRGKFVEQEWVAFYATIFARSAVNEIGLFDTAFQNGCEDLDFCLRLKKYGYKIGQAYDSFVFHFGGISRGSYEQECSVIKKEG